MDGDHNRLGKSDSAAMSSSVLSADAKEFIPSNYAPDVSDAVIAVNGSIDALLNSPEMFFEVANDLSASLSKSLADDDTQLTPVMKTLFDVSVSEDNFRYSGARLLSFLCEHLPENDGQKFRSQLLNTCKDVYQQRDKLVSDNPSLLTQFTLFMAELTCSLMKFPSCLLDLLSSLLVVSSDESIKGFVQTLKLTGAVLERHDTSRLEELFANVKQKIADDQSSTIQRSLLLSVVELKAASWLATGDSSSTEQHSQTASESQCDERPDIVQDVIEYSDDEDDVNYTDKHFEIVYDGDVEYAVEREMDPDMEDEYEKFIAENEAQWLSNHTSRS